MNSKKELLASLQKLKKQKRGKAFYSEKLNIPMEEVESLLKELRDDGMIDEDVYRRVNNDKGTLESTVVTDFEPKDDKELAILHKVDTTKYKITNYWTKQRGRKFTSSLLCTLIKHDKDLGKQKDVILKELMDYSKYVTYKRPHKKVVHAYELNIPDVHFGKLAWKAESGEDYDLSIAEKRYEAAIEDLLSYVDLEKIEEIIFPIGNDMVNIDSRRNETFAGTGQDSDSRFYKIVQVVKRILIKNINSLSQIAPVRVIVVAGNHDPETMFMLGEILDAYYHNNDNVEVDNSPRQRKYYQYGLNGFQYTHGNEEKHSDLGPIFATEEKRLWADTDFRFCKVGHFHKNKKTQFVSVDEFQGFQVQILPSLSGSDAWHNSKGYNSLKAAKGFLYHKEKGQVGEFTHNVISK